METEIGTLLWENEDWMVTDVGLIAKTDEDELDAYTIEKERLLDKADEWIPHMTSKCWVDPASFLDAFYMACKLVGGREFVRNKEVEIPNRKRYYDEQEPEPLRTEGFKLSEIDLSKPTPYPLERVLIASEHTHKFRNNPG